MTRTAAIGIIALMTIACSTPETEEQIPCGTILDCPEGMECGPDYFCIEKGSIDTDTPSGDHDTAFPDTMTDEASPDGADALIIDDEGPVDDASSPVDDQPVTLDEDPLVPDEMTDELLPEQDEVATDEDELLSDETPDEDMADETQTDESGADELLSDAESLPVDDAVMTDDDIVLPDTVIVGTGTESTYPPLSTAMNYRRSIAIYTAAEIARPGTIIDLGWYLADTSSGSPTVQIYLKTTTETVAPTTWDTTDATLVYDSSTSLSSTGWKDFTLTTPFPYFSSDNLVVMVASYISSWKIGGKSNYTDTPGINSFSEGNSDTSWPSSLTGSTSRPNIRISF